MDTPSYGLEITVIILLILANGIFALTEMAVISSRKSRLEKMANEGSVGAKIALELAENPDQLLSTIQVGITLIGIMTGTFGGATLSKIVAFYLKKVPFIAPYSDTLSLAIVVSLITYVSLIIGELAPKRIALNSPETLAVLVAKPMRTFAWLATPIVHFLSASTNFVMKLLGIKPSDEPPVTEDEIKILIEQGTEAGAFEKAEQDMVHSVFRLGDLRAYDLMTPRTHMVWLDIEDTPEINLDILTDSSHSRFLVGRGSLDDLVGIVYTRDLLAGSLKGEPLDLSNYVRKPLLVPRSMKAFRMLELFKQQGAHEGVVLDEYGGVLGFITLHDILGEIIGDMPLSDNETEPLVVQREDGSWLMDGLLAIEELKDILNINELPEEERDHFHTLGGYIISHLGHIPATSDKFEWNGMRFEVVDMDRVRVDKVLVTVIQPEDDQER